MSLQTRLPDATASKPKHEAVKIGPVSGDALAAIRRKTLRRRAGDPVSSPSHLSASDRDLWAQVRSKQEAQHRLIERGAPLAG